MAAPLESWFEGPLANVRARLGIADARDAGSADRPRRLFTAA
jgi:hypothetical protein